MSFKLNPKSIVLVTKLGKVSTLPDYFCTICTSTTTEENPYVDLHITKEQAVQLREGLNAVLNEDEGTSG